MKCRNCGKRIRASAKFCMHCGVNDPTQQTDVKDLPSQGTTPHVQTSLNLQTPLYNPQGCLYSATQEGRQPSEPATNTKKDRTTKPWLWVIAILSCIALILSCVAVIFVTSQVNGTEKMQNNISSTQAESSGVSEKPAEPTGSFGLIGVCFPTRDLQRWQQDGENIKQQLEAAGYEVDLLYAANDPATQIYQIENMIVNGAKVLIVASIDGEALGAVLAQAKEAGVAVIAYDRLIMGSDAVTYYATFDNFLVGVLQGQYIVDSLDLANNNGPFNIEFITGDPGDNKIHFFFDGAMSILQPYLDAGILVCQSGQTEKYDVTTEGWDAANAQARFEYILSTYYADKPLHAVMASNDSTAQGVADALMSAYSNDIYPVITGQDCDIISMWNILDGKQAMSVFKDTRDLAAKTVEMADAIAKGMKPPINDIETYDNGTGVIPSYLCAPIVCTIENYKELMIDSGYYTEDQLNGTW